MLSRKPYTPDFIIRQNGQEIYVEHFGITEDGQNSLYTEEQLNMYKKAVNDKTFFINNMEQRLFIHFLLIKTDEVSLHIWKRNCVSMELS